MLVIPNTMAVALWSPPLDEIGNTARGVQLSQVLIMLLSDYLDGSFLIGKTSLRNSSTASISTDLTTCATRRRSRIPRSTIWPPRASPPLHCFSQQLLVIFPHSKGMMPAQPCTLWGDNLFQRFGFMIHICSTGPLANTAIVVLPDQTMVSIWSSLISDYKTFGTT